MIEKDVLLVIPCYDHKLEVMTAQEAFGSMYDARTPVRKVHYYNGDSLVTRARNACASAFLDMEDVQYLMFVDSDIHFNRFQIKQLREHDKGIVGGVYLKKKLPYQPVCNNRISKEESTGLAIMREIGTGFMMIRRDVFMAIMEKWPEHKYIPYKTERQNEYHYDWFRVGPCEETGYYLSEDYYFCKLARECGYEVFLDESILVEHSGRAVYPMRDTDVLDGASTLLNAYKQESPVERKMLDSVLTLDKVTNAFMEKRGIK